MSDEGGLVVIWAITFLGVLALLPWVDWTWPHTVVEWAAAAGCLVFALGVLGVLVASVRLGGRRRRFGYHPQHTVREGGDDES